IVKFLCRKLLLPQDPEAPLPYRISSGRESRYLFSFYDLFHPHITGQVPQSPVSLSSSGNGLSVKRVEIQAVEKDMEVSSQDSPGIFPICPNQISRREIKEFSVRSYGSGLFIRTISQTGKSSVQIRKIRIQLIPAVLEDPDSQVLPAFLFFPVHVAH